MNDLTNTVMTLGKPYTITKSRLAAITKVFDDKYICDLGSLREIFDHIAEKLAPLSPKKDPEFSFLISYADKTHQDGLVDDLNNLNQIPTGKQTDRVVMRWSIVHDVNGEDNDLSITIRISNPINPLVFLQAALSKSPNEIDNVEFEMGSTCVTVDGAGQSYSDEVFLRIQNWINARNKPHAFISVGSIYNNYEWYIDRFNGSVLPLLAVCVGSIYASINFDLKDQLAATPILIGIFFVLQSIASKVNTEMAKWAAKSRHIGLFQLTNGDVDAVTKMAAKSKNGAIKLIGTAAVSFILNLSAGVACWWLLSA